MVHARRPRKTRAPPPPAWRRFRGNPVPGEGGDHIVAARALFGSCRLGRGNAGAEIRVECTLVDGAIQELGRRGASEHQGLLLESPTKPDARSDRHRRRRQARRSDRRQGGGDNVFATPLFQKPLELGAHVVVYSATKQIDGQGRCLGAWCSPTSSGSTRTCTTISVTPARPCRPSTPGRC